jgi:hypothetical protein
MPDDNVTIQPVFYDKAAVYALDYTDVASGALPVGWRTTDGSDVRNYPTSNGSGPRTFAGLTGYQGKALYWRNTSAEYGRLSNYLLPLEPGKYQLTFAMAAWKGAPSYQAAIIQKSTGATVKSSSSIVAKPDLNGNGAGDISSAVRHTLDFEVKTKDNYVIQFKSVSSGFTEFLLAECRLRDLSTTGIATIGAASRWPRGIYSPTGMHRQALQHGLNIVVDADGRVRKVFVR